MPFSDSFRKVAIKQGTLTAECKKNDNKTWISSSLNLDEFLGNVDGKFVLGGKGFSLSAQDVTLSGSVITAKLKNSAGKYVEAKFDLGEYVVSQDGILAAYDAHIVAQRPALAAIQSVGTASSMAAMSASHSSSTTSVSQSISKSSSYHSSKVFKSSSFRHFSQQFLLEEFCTNFVLKGTFLHCDIHHEDGRVTHTSFDLSGCIGNVEGRLVWDSHSFHQTCKDIHLENLWLKAKCRHHIHHDEYHAAALDLRPRLRLQGDAIIFIETNKKLSMMLSEVPWMKFKVIAEPDLGVFSSHPVIQQTMTRIAESTVEHVTHEMHKMLTIAMESAIIAVTESAMKHISLQMQHTVQDAVGYAVASPSATESEFLHIGAASGYFKGGYGGWGSLSGSAGGHIHASGAQSAGIHYNGGFNGAAHGAAHSYSGAVYQSNGTSSVSRSASESSSITTSSVEARSESSASSVSTQQAVASTVKEAITAA